MLRLRSVQGESGAVPRAAPCDDMQAIVPGKAKPSLTFRRGMRPPRAEQQTMAERRSLPAPFQGRLLPLAALQCGNLLSLQVADLGEQLHIIGWLGFGRVFSRQAAEGAHNEEVDHCGFEQERYQCRKKQPDRKTAEDDRGKILARTAKQYGDERVNERRNETIDHLTKCCADHHRHRQIDHVPPEYIQATMTSPAGNPSPCVASPEILTECCD